MNPLFISCYTVCFHFSVSATLNSCSPLFKHSSMAAVDCKPIEYLLTGFIILEVVSQYIYSMQLSVFNSCLQLTYLLNLNHNFSCECDFVSLFCRNSSTFKSFEDKMGNLKVSQLFVEQQGCTLLFVTQKILVFTKYSCSVKSLEIFSLDIYQMNKVSSIFTNNEQSLYCI